MKITAIIPSGGTGSRIGQSTPKQYLKFCDKELIAYTLSVFQNNALINSIIIPAQKQYFHLLEQIKEKYNFHKIEKIIEGGATRQESVYNGLLNANLSNTDLVAVHDAARPLLPQNVLTSSLNLAKTFDSVLVAIKAQDTLVKGNEIIEEHLNRKEIFYAQTPQVFRYGILYDAMKKAFLDNFVGTDESMLVKRAGNQVKICEGSSLNFKITTKNDIQLFKSIINDN